MKQKAFLLIEELLKVLCLSFILNFFLLLLRLVYQYPWPSVSQWSVFQRQFRQLMQRARIVHCDNPLSITYRNELFEMYVDDKQRLVKTPGYEILMHDVDFFDVDLYPDNICNIYILHDGRELHLALDYES